MYMPCVFGLVNPRMLKSSVEPLHLRNSICFKHHLLESLVNIRAVSSTTLQSFQFFTPIKFAVCTHENCVGASSIGK